MYVDVGRSVLDMFLRCSHGCLLTFIISALYILLPDTSWMLIRRLRDCFAIISLNRSKSVRPDFNPLSAIFFAQVVSSHFLVISSFSQGFFNVPVHAPGGIFTTHLVRCICLKFMLLRPTPVQGPSTKALFWSMTLTMTTSLPSSHLDQMPHS